MNRVISVLTALYLGCGAPIASVDREPRQGIADESTGEPPNEGGRSAARGCVTDAPPSRVQLRAGESRTSGSGLTITWVGSGHDDFDDGVFDDWLELRFEFGDRIESRIVSLRSPRHVEPIFERACWYLATASEPITVEVFPHAAADRRQRR